MLFARKYKKKRQREGGVVSQKLPEVNNFKPIYFLSIIRIEMSKVKSFYRVEID